jgi:cytochrome c oxidase subunit 2
MNTTFRLLALLSGIAATVCLTGCGQAPDTVAESPAPTAAELAHAGEALYKATCAACHGSRAEGMKALNAPALAGQEDWYVARQLRLFKAGVRGTDPAHVPGTQMAAIAKTVKDADIPALAAFVAQLPKATHATEVQGDAGAGKVRFDAVCTACHGQAADGNRSLNSPRLTTLNDWYMAAQLNQFVHGTRGTLPQDTFGLQMRPMAATLDSPEAINDVVSHIAQLQSAQ